MDPATPPADSPLPHSCAAGAILGQLLREDRLDASIESGLMEFMPCPSCATEVSAVVCGTQQRLRQAWAARDRHLARKARLARQAEAQAGKRRATSDAGATALPSAAAAVLARARARAKGSELK